MQRAYLQQLLRFILNVRILGIIKVVSIIDLVGLAIVLAVVAGSSTHPRLYPYLLLAIALGLARCIVGHLGHLIR